MRTHGSFAAGDTKWKEIKCHFIIKIVQLISEDIKFTAKPSIKQFGIIFLHVTPSNNFCVILGMQAHWW